MKIKFHKKFDKQYKKLNSKDKIKIHDLLNIFMINPKDKRLKNHSLKGSLIGKRAVSVDYDLRIIFEEFENYTLVIFLDLGTHNRVY